MRLGTISNPNEVIHRKVNHFYDYIHYLLDNNRDRVKYSGENHLTLLERIANRVENCSLNPSTRNLIETYLNNPLFNCKSDRLARKGKLKKVLCELKTIHKKSSFTNPDFKQKLHETIEVLNGSDLLNGELYFQKVLENLVKMLRCDCSLGKHKDDIEYYAKLLVFEFLRVDYEKKHLVGLRGFFYRILSKETDLTDRENDNIYSEFPLPPAIEANRNQPGFKKEVEEYLNSLDFQKQFGGLSTLFKKEKTGKVIYKVKYVSEVHEDFDVTHEGVRFFHRSRLSVNLDHWKDYQIEDLNEFIDEKFTCLAEVELNFKIESIGRQKAIVKIKEAIEFLNYVGKDYDSFKHGAILDMSKSYIFYDTNGNFQWDAESIQVSNQLANRRLSALYPDEFYAFPFATQKTIKWADKSIFRSNSSAILEDKIVYLWRFLECIFAHLPMNKGDDIKKKVSSALLTKYAEKRKQYLSLFIGNAAHNSDHKTLNISITPNELRKRLHKIHKDDEDILTLSEFIDYPFLNEKFADYQYMEKPIDYQDAHDYYSMVMKEAHEQRNSILHQGVSCYSTLKKLNSCLFNLIIRFRRAIMEQLIENPTLSIEDAIEQLHTEGISYLPKKRLEQ